jgi:hypothetical protein
MSTTSAERGRGRADEALAPRVHNPELIRGANRCPEKILLQQNDESADRYTVKELRDRPSCAGQSSM